MITEKETQQLLRELSKGYTIQGIVEKMTREKKKEIQVILELLEHSYSTQRILEDFCEWNCDDENACDDFEIFLRDEKIKFIMNHVENSIYDAKVLLVKLLEGHF